MHIKTALGVLLSILNAEPDMVKQMAKHVNAETRFQLLTVVTFISVLISIINAITSYIPAAIGVLLALGLIWREYFVIQNKGIEDHLLIYIKATADRNRDLPIAQIVDPSIQQKELNQNRKKDQINGILTALCIVMMFGSIIYFRTHSFVASPRTKANQTVSTVSAVQSVTPMPAYIVENGQATILYNLYVEANDGELSIPSQVDGYPVVGIGKLAFAGRNDFTSAVVPESVVFIDSGAFKNCSKLQQITLPQSLQELGAEVFQNCHSLLQCTIPNNVKEVRSHAFDSCKSLKQISLPEELSKIGEYSFSNCSSLELVQMPQCMPYGKISQYAFENCKSLTHIRIPEGVDKISTRAFYQCSLLSDVELPMSLKTISSSAFRSCRSLKSIVIPKGCSVDGKAFKDSPTSIRRK